MISGRLMAAMAVQGAGAAATFAVGIAIAAWQGPVAQGHYGIVRSTADLLLALALFGFPQGLVDALNRRGANAEALARLALRYAGALAALGLALPAALALAGRLPAGWLSGPLAWAALLVGSAGWVVQQLLRAFVLCRASALRFAWVSVAPALTLLLAVAVLLAVGSARHEFALLASGIASAALALFELRRLREHRDWHAGGAVPLHSLLRDGGHAFSQSAALALQPWLTLWLLQRQGVAPSQIGEFVFAAYVFQAFALPTTFVAPLLFARISRAAGAGLDFAARAIVLRVVALSAAAALALAVLLPWLVTAWFGPRYAGAVAACIVLALGGPLVVANRLGVSVLFGRGRFAAASWHAAVRALTLPPALWAASHDGRVGPVGGAALAWVAVEAACLLVLGGLLGRPRRGKAVPPAAAPSIDREHA